MIDLDTLANLVEVLGALTIIGGVLFAVVQIRQYRQQLREIRRQTGSGTLCTSDKTLISLTYR